MIIYINDNKINNTKNKYVLSKINILLRLIKLLIIGINANNEVISISKISTINVLKLSFFQL